MTDSKTARSIPQVDKLLRHPLLAEVQTRMRRELLAELVRRELSTIREAGNGGAAVPELDDIAAAVVERVERLTHGGLRRVLNGTGVILNTNLGRAPLPRAAVEKLTDVLPGYCSLEIDLRSGKRGERIELLQELLSLLTGCEAALVVNNNAAAVMLAVTALAHGKDVIVSRGELIEIGGSFRLPDVITSAGGNLREVGTTNRTRLDDYRKALSPNSGMFLRCHRSNYQITGFTEEASIEELAALSIESGIPFIEDLGSGAIIDLSRIGLKDEPTVPQVLKAGTQVVLFSGDKLLGGVQSGIVVGKRELIETMRKHPIYRALRADKLIISILEAVLAQYLAPAPENAVPALRMATIDPETLRLRAANLKESINAKLSSLHGEVVSTTSAFGGGTLPGEDLPSFGLHLQSRNKKSAEAFANALRMGTPSVVPFVADNKVIIDMRTIQPDEESLLFDALERLDRNL